MGRNYGYMQVYSYRNKLHQNTYDEQKKALEDAGATELIADRSSGANMNTAERSKLLEKLMTGDTLIVTALDKLGATAVEASTSVSALMERGVTVKILNMWWADDCNRGTILVTVLRAFAAFEHAKHMESVQVGKSNAHELGVCADGRPSIPQELVASMMKLKNDGYSIKRIAAETGTSESTVKRKLEKQKAVAYLSEHRAGEEPMAEPRQAALKDVVAGVYAEEAVGNVCVVPSTEVKPTITLPPATWYDDVEDDLIAIYGEARVNAAAQEEDLQDDEVVQDICEDEPARGVCVPPAAEAKPLHTLPPNTLDTDMHVDDDPTAFSGVTLVDDECEEESYQDDDPAEKGFREGVDDLFSDLEEAKPKKPRSRQ